MKILSPTLAIFLVGCSSFFPSIKPLSQRTGVAIEKIKVRYKPLESEITLPLFHYQENYQTRYPGLEIYSRMETIVGETNPRHTIISNNVSGNYFSVGTGINYKITNHLDFNLGLEAAHAQAEIKGNLGPIEYAFKEKSAFLWKAHAGITAHCPISFLSKKNSNAPEFFISLEGSLSDNKTDYATVEESELKAIIGIRINLP